jgi:protoporphyrinogen oxidase
MYAARRTGLKKEMFGYVRGGYGRVLERFAEKLQETGVGVKLNHRIERVEQRDGKFTLSFAGGASQTFDRVVLTVPSGVAAQVCPQLNESEKAKLNGVEYQGIVCASVLLKESLGPYYVTNITDDFAPFTAVIEMSALVDKAEFGGHALVYLPKYVAPDDPIFAESDTAIKERFLAALARMYPHFKPETDVITFQLSRVRQVFPLPTVNYSAKLPAQTTSLPGLHIINSAHILNGTLNVNETIQLAENTAARLLEKA